MKVCSRCKLQKSLGAFGNNKNKKDGKQSCCRLCVKEINADYYKRTPEKNDQRKAGSAKVKKRNRTYIYEILKSSRCVDCGNGDWRVFEFDHVRGVKDKEVSLLMQYASIERLAIEIDKCDIRCANCHRIKTFIEQDWYKDVRI